MKWSKLTSPQQLADIKKESEEQPVLIFKHSTRCGTSRLVLDRLERNWRQEEMGNLKPYFLDLLSYREISNAIADQFDVEHESPQVLIIANGQAVYDQSHLGIDYHNIKEQLRN